MIKILFVYNMIKKLYMVSQNYYYYIASYIYIALCHGTSDSDDKPENSSKVISQILFDSLR